MANIQQGKVECPYCHSKDTKKISGMSKVGSVALWGVFAAGKVSKQWHCNSCKSDFYEYLILTVGEFLPPFFITAAISRTEVSKMPPL